MAVRTGSGTWVAKSVHSWSCTGILNGDTTTNLNAPALNDKSVSINGTFGTGGSITIEGSNDGGTTYDTLHDVNGNVLTFTAKGTKAVAENMLLIRGNCTAGDGTTSLTMAVLSTTAGGG